MYCATKRSRKSPKADRATLRSPIRSRCRTSLPPAPRAASPADPDASPDLVLYCAERRVSVMDDVLRLSWESEGEHVGDYERMPLGRLEQDGETVRFVADFTQPSMNLAAAPQR